MSNVNDPVVVPITEAGHGFNAMGEEYKRRIKGNHQQALEAFEAGLDRDRADIRKMVEAKRLGWIGQLGFLIPDSSIDMIVELIVSARMKFPQMQWPTVMEFVLEGVESHFQGRQ
jgi:hypothetical protein